MGYMRHNAIVVTSWNEQHIKDARISAINIFGLGNQVSEILKSPVNGYLSFFICPDGSKEGWEDSKNGDKHRKFFLDEITKSGLYVEWVDVSYGGDDPDKACIDSHSIHEKED